VSLDDLRRYFIKLVDLPRSAWHIFIFLVRIVYPKGATYASGYDGMGDGALDMEGDHLRSAAWNNFSNPLTSALLPLLYFPFPLLCTQQPERNRNLLEYKYKREAEVYI